MQKIGKKLAKNLMKEEQPQVAPKERPVREKMLGFRESDWIITPNLYAGPNQFNKSYEDDRSILFGGGGISFGYQFNPHLSVTLGVSFDGGYTVYAYSSYTYKLNRPNIDATFKYYPINHKNSFLLGVTITSNFYTKTYDEYAYGNISFVNFVTRYEFGFGFGITPFVGFAFGNLETSLGYYYLDLAQFSGSLCLKLEYRLPVSDKSSSLFNKLKWW